MKKGGRWLIVIAISGLVAFLFLAGPNGLVKLIKMKQSQAELEKRMVQLQADIEITRRKLDKLETDPDYLRKVAAEKLKMIDPSDYVKKDSTSQQTTSSSDTSTQSGSGG